MIENMFRRLEFADDLNDFMELHSLTLKDVADLAGCSTAYVLYVRRGAEYDHQIGILMRIADLMDKDFRMYITRGRK